VDDPKSVNPAVWIIYVIIATAIVFLSAVKDDKYTPIIQTFVLTLTLFTIVWYTFETYRMQKAVSAQLGISIRQVNLSVLPFFIAHVGKGQADNELHRPVDILELENIGKGEALNVTVDRLDIVMTGDTVQEQEGLDELLPGPYIIFDPTMIIRADDEEMITHRSYIQGQDEPTETFDWLKHLKPARATIDYDLKIRFMDVLGNRYVQTVHIGKSGSWPDVVEADTSDRRYGYPAVALVSPFTQSPLRYITSKERRDIWRRL
jgi:hypothetical protein